MTSISIDWIVEESLVWLRAEFNDSIAALTVGYDRENKILKYLIYYYGAENKIQAEEIADYISGEVNAHIWNEVEQIKIHSEEMIDPPILKKYERWIFVKNDLLKFLNE